MNPVRVGPGATALTRIPRALSSLGWHAVCMFPPWDRTVPEDACGSPGYRVGYDSASQFSREYRRQFGLPPGRDAARLRADASAA